MTEQATEAATASANGQGPVPEPAAEPDTGEKWLGVLLIASAVFLALIGLDRVTGGKLTAALTGGGDAEG